MKFPCAVSLALAACLAACGPTVQPFCHSDCDGASPDVADAHDVAFDLPPSDVLHTMHIVSVALDPPMATLTSTNGSMPMQPFTATATFADGTTGPAPRPFFSLDSRAIADIDSATGVLVASGLQGGMVQVSVSVPDPTGGPAVTATAMVTVVLQFENYAPGTPTSASTHFTTPGVTDGTRAATIDYPLDGAVMPQNVAPADVQWERGNAGDIFRVTLSKPGVSAVTYVLSGAGFHNDLVVDTTAWHAVAQTAPDATATLTVDRFDVARGDVVTSPPVSLRFANGVVLGSVYYWDLGAGESIRVDDGTGIRTHFMPYPPGSTATGHGCIGCHAISHDGRYLSAETGDFQGAVFDLTRDLTPRPAPTVYPLGTNPAWFWSSFNPDSTRIVADHGSLGLYDPITGMSVAPRSGSLPSANAAQPTWSPDGRAIAYAANIDSGYGNVDFVRADIGVVPVTGPDAFGPPTIIHRGADLPGGQSDNYPSWTPDSRWIAFAHGTGYRGDSDHDALYLVAATGGTATLLARACGGATATNNYIPNFSPFNSGGYYWFTFQSTRDYGNALAGTRGTHRPQIWVAAVSSHPMPGTDPSEVAYWLPGQDAAEQNIEAFWAPHACRRNGEACGVSSECCTGECRAGSGGMQTCQPPPSCHSQGRGCSADSDCCMSAGLTCQGNVCLPPAPP